MSYENSMGDHWESQEKGEGEQQKRVHMSVRKDESYEDFKERVKAAMRQAGILASKESTDEEAPGRRPE